MPKAFSAPEKEILRNRLLEAGHRQFSTYGLKKTSVDELVAAAGISKGAFYIFYSSKEEFFMDVVEQVEQHFRREVLEVIDLPGPSPRARLVAVFKKAFTLWKSVPVLQIFTRADYEILARRVPAEKLQEHLSSDRIFMEELVERCRQAGIPIRAPLEAVGNLMYALFFTSLHESDFGAERLQGTLDLLAELVAAFSLGEIDVPSFSNPKED